MSILATEYPDRMEAVLGLRLSMGAVGFMTAPILGSAMYKLLGFSWMFLIYSIIYALFLPILKYILP